MLHPGFPATIFPSIKTMLEISITNDSSMVSVSNGVLVDVITDREEELIAGGLNIRSQLT